MRMLDHHSGFEFEDTMGLVFEKLGFDSVEVIVQTRLILHQRSYDRSIRTGARSELADGGGYWESAGIVWDKQAQHLAL